MASIRVDRRNILIFYSETIDLFEIQIQNDCRVTADNIRLFAFNKKNNCLDYLPDITPVDRTINRVEYNWHENTVSVYLNDIYRTTPYVFPAIQNMGEQDCIDLINKYTDEQLKNYDL